MTLRVDILGESAPLTQSPASTTYWHGLRGDVKEHVQNCNICQRTKVHHHRKYGEMESASKPVEDCNGITLEFITGVWYGLRRYLVGALAMPSRFK
jgi:Integrase zinc binding domain